MYENHLFVYHHLIYQTNIENKVVVMRRGVAAAHA